ncbi:MAG: HAD-IA family hydrolase [Verrucomicrobia bacterium]|nr:HAD-IA family hydrolase [Verrucomicrobiota bacterium]
MAHAARAPIRAVTFDVGGTLIEVWPSVGHVYAEVAARHGIIDLSAKVLERRFAAAWRGAKKFSHSRSGWARLVDATFRGLTDRPPSRTFFPELYARFTSPNVWHVFEDVVPTLDALAARGVKLGVISNWDERLRPLLEELKLADYFQAIVVSREVGASKPSRAIFKQAIRMLGLPPADILHVGDSLSMDVQGARDSGLSAVLLDRTAGVATARQIRSLRELCRSSGATTRAVGVRVALPAGLGPRVSARR